MDKIATGSASDRRDLFSESATQLGMSAAVVEKDFWVCWILKSLFADPQLKEQMVFKGGTSLSKVHGLIDRFSEDIDLVLGWRLLGYGTEDGSDPYQSISSKTKSSAVRHPGGTKNTVTRPLEFAHKRRKRMRYPVGTLAVFVLGGTLQSIPVRAQIQNPIQAAKDAYNKARQQSQQKKRQGQTQNQQPAPTQTASAAQPAAPAPQNGAVSNDCCSADALKRQAAAASSLDIVGIKLGMRPAQVTAAIKAYNPSYKSWVVNTRMVGPSNPNGFTRVPRYIFAVSPNTNLANGPIEHITIKFTSPPNPPVVQEVERYMTFQIGQPILASNLMNSFRQKYGQENSGNPGGPIWVYDSNGKLLTRVPNEALNCQPTGNLSSYIAPGDPTHDAQDGGLNLSNTADGQGVGNGLTPGCVPYLYAEAWSTGVTPNDKVSQMEVSIRSGALTYNSMKSVHNWLQSQTDALQKKNDSDAAGRAAPKL